MKQVTAAIIRDGDKLLIGQRAADDECPLQWEFPGGKLEEGETLEECITREIKEELSLEIAVQDVYATTVYRLAEKEVSITFFNARVTGGEIRKNVHNDVRWIKQDEMTGYRFMPPDREVVDRLIREAG